MADMVTLGDVSTKDTGSGSKLKTGGRRKYNIPKACVKKKMKQGMSKSAAIKACYPGMKKVEPKKVNLKKVKLKKVKLKKVELKGY